MKKLFSLSMGLALAGALFAQVPTNDNCSSLVSLGTAPACPTTVFTNLNATASNIGANNVPACFKGGANQRDVWFSFVCPDTLFDFRITVAGTGANPLTQPQFAVYRGACATNGLLEILCASSLPGDTSLFIDIEGLTPTATYFIRVADYSTTATPNWGDFTVCISKIPPVATIDQGGSSLCNGTLYDTGGPDNDYDKNEDETFVICPKQASACLTFTLEYYNLEAPSAFPPQNADFLTFYDGKDINAPVISTLGGANFGGGAVCYQVQASSGCLTVQFQSDNSMQFEGWKGDWHCSSQPCQPSPPLVVNNNITNDSIVKAVSTPFTTVTVTSVNCPKSAHGIFQYASADNNLGLGRGIMLTTGNTSNAIGANSVISNPGTPLNTAGDADLDYLSALQGDTLESFDACIVELDVFAATDELAFEYVFGSEEYPEFVADNYNDIFAFLISGPGIVGDPNLGGAKNIAVLPNTNTPVEIASVNNVLNWQYYRNNPPGNQTLQYDGFTSDYLGIKKSLTARTAVIPCNTYHLKLAIADRVDNVYDSGVFIAEIRGGSPEIKPKFVTGIDYLIEGCSGLSEQISISLQDTLPQPYQLKIALSGTATRGLDYTTTLPDSVIFLPGQTEFLFPIIPITDAINEGTETIVIAIFADFGCDTVVFKTLTIELRESVQVKLSVGDTLVVCNGQQPEIQASGATTYFWSPVSAVSNHLIANPKITISADTWLEVLGTVGACPDKDSVFLDFTDPQVTIVALSDSNLCLGESVALQALNNVNDEGLKWEPTTGLDNPLLNTPIATPTETTLYRVSVTSKGCTVSDEILVQVDTLFFPTLAPTATICQNYSYQLANVLESTSIYSWMPMTALSDSTSSGPFASPDQTTTYVLTVNSAQGFCPAQTGSVTVNVTPADINILGDAYRELCLGESDTLRVQINPLGGSEITWTSSLPFSAGLDTEKGAIVVATPDESVTVYATYTVNGCTVTDSVRLRVDSLPLLDIIAMPVKDPYCPGDTVKLYNSGPPWYDVSSFPDILHVWDKVGLQIPTDSALNIILIATDSLTMRRVTTNHGCRQVDTIDIPVGIIPTIEWIADTICPGGISQITLTKVDPAGTVLEWKEDPTLTVALDKLSAVASPFMSTNYMITTPEADCPGGTSVTVIVLPPPVLELAPNPSFICQGGSIVLNNSVALPGTVFGWSSEPVGFIDSTATPTVSPNVSTTYTVVATSADGCTSTGNVRVEIATATLTAGPTQNICSGSPVTLTAVANSPNGTEPLLVTWAGLPAGNPVTFIPTATTVYTAVLNYGPNCPPLTATTQVNVVPIPNLQLANDTSICPGSAVKLNGLADPSAAGYVWTVSNPSSPVPNGATPTVNPTQTTRYQVVATGPAPTSCRDTGSVTVTVVTANAGPDQRVCEGTSITLNAATNVSRDSIIWQPGPFPGNPYVAIPAESTIYTVSILGCPQKDSVFVQVLPKVLISAITGKPSPGDGICEGLPIALKATVDPANTPLVWLENGKVIPGLTRDSVNITAAGDNITVVYSVKAASADVCSDSVAIVYEVKRCFNIPNAFTPNGDEVNDSFGVVPPDAKVSIEYFAIYNRWGEKIFESNPNKLRWDGKVDGKDALAEVYAYVMRVRFPDGTVKEYKNDVTLLR